MAGNPVSDRKPARGFSYPPTMEKLAAALVAAQSEFAPLAKTATNPHFKNKFVPLSEVLQNVLPVLTANGLAVAQFPCQTGDGAPGLRTVLLHESGQTLESTMPLLAAKQDPQGQGSAITYARRYALMSVLGLVGDEDDDGNAASKPAAKLKVSDLDAAKEALRAAITSAGLSKDDAAQYAWVKSATAADIDKIRGAAMALKMGKAI